MSLELASGSFGNLASPVENAQFSGAFVDWVRANDVETLLVVSICNDICVMYFVLTTLAAYNRGMLSDGQKIIVYDATSATYDLPYKVAETLGFSYGAAHP